MPQKKARQNCAYFREYTVSSLSLPLNNLDDTPIAPNVRDSLSQYAVEGCVSNSGSGSLSLRVVKQLNVCSVTWSGSRTWHVQVCSKWGNGCNVDIFAMLRKYLSRHNWPSDICVCVWGRVSADCETNVNNYFQYNSIFKDNALHFVVSVRGQILHSIHYTCWQHHEVYIDVLVQERRNSIANALELRLSCTNPSIYRYDTCPQFPSFTPQVAMLAVLLQGNTYSRRLWFILKIDLNKTFVSIVSLANMW